MIAGKTMIHNCQYSRKWFARPAGVHQRAPLPFGVFFTFVLACLEAGVERNGFVPRG